MKCVNWLLNFAEDKENFVINLDHQNPVTEEKLLKRKLLTYEKSDQEVVQCLNQVRNLQKVSEAIMIEMRIDYDQGEVIVMRKVEGNHVVEVGVGVAVDQITGRGVEALDRKVDIVEVVLENVQNVPDTAAIVIIRIHVGPDHDPEIDPIGIETHPVVILLHLLLETMIGDRQIQHKRMKVRELIVIG